MNLVRTVILGGMIALGGCATHPQDFNVAPGLTPVGAGVPAVVPPPPPPHPVNVVPAGRDGDYSLWHDSSSNLFRNPRAMYAGDVLTVHIRIDDEASLDNSTNRARDSKASIGGGAEAELDGSTVVPFSFGVSGKGSANSGSSSKGWGSIARKEDIRLSVAAVVTQVLPNGNLMISGSQEVRVNHEVRVLTIAGIVRPQDIKGDNTVRYDKIAEARISYGGRGRITEVQQPGWGQQLYDILTPF